MERMRVVEEIFPHSAKQVEVVEVLFCCIWLLAALTRLGKVKNCANVFKKGGEECANAFGKLGDSTKASLRVT